VKRLPLLAKPSDVLHRSPQRAYAIVNGCWVWNESCQVLRVFRHHQRRTTALLHMGFSLASAARVSTSCLRPTFLLVFASRLSPCLYQADAGLRTSTRRRHCGRLQLSLHCTSVRFGRFGGCDVPLRAYSAVARYRGAAACSCTAHRDRQTFGAGRRHSLARAAAISGTFVPFSTWRDEHGIHAIY